MFVIFEKVPLCYAFTSVPNIYYWLELNYNIGYVTIELSC